MGDGMRNLWKITALLVTMLAPPALAADSTVPAMTAAGAITGTDLFYCIQSGGTLNRKCTATQLQTFNNAFPMTVNGTVNSGGIPYFSSATGMASSAVLAANALVIGGGAGVAPSTTGTGAGVLTFLATPSSANLAGALTDETGSGAAVFATSPTLVTPTLGVASATSVNKVALTAPTTSATLTIADGKTLTANNSLTLAGTDATVMTFPGVSATIPGVGVANTFSAAQTFTSAAPQLTLGVNATTLGSIKFFGNTSGDLTLSPAAAAGTASVVTLPGRSGTVAYTSGTLTSGNCAKFDASGNIVDNGATCGGGGTPGGSDTQVQFNDGGAFGGDSGLVFNKTANALTLGGATVTTNIPVLDMSQTWNAGGVTFSGVKLNITNTASAAASKLFDVQVGAASKFSVGVGGTTFATNDSTSSGVATTLAFGSDQNEGFNRDGELIRLISSGANPVSFGWAHGVKLAADQMLQWSSNTFDTNAPDTIIKRGGAAATIAFGAADAASPVAQTLKTQAVVVGTTNTAGALWTFKDSLSTGTAKSGGFEFDTAAVGSSGSSQNTHASAFTIGVIGDTIVQIKKAQTVANLPTCNAGAQGSMAVVTDANATTFHTTAAGGGANVMKVFCDGTNWYLD